MIVRSANPFLERDGPTARRRRRSAASWAICQMRLRTVRMTSASGRRERQGETRLPPSRRERGVSRDRRCSIMERKARRVFGIHYSISNGRDSVSDVQWSQALTLVLVSASPPTAHGSTYIGVELPFCSSPAIHPMSSMRRACLLWPGSSISLCPVPRLLRRSPPGVHGLQSSRLRIRRRTHARRSSAGNGHAVRAYARVTRAHGLRAGRQKGTGGHRARAAGAPEGTACVTRHARCAPSHRRTLALSHRWCCGARSAAAAPWYCTVRAHPLRRIREVSCWE